VDDSDLLIPPPPTLAGTIAPPSEAESAEATPETAIETETRVQAGGSLTPGEESEPTTDAKGKGRNPYYWAHRRNQEKQGLPVNRRPRKK
jgi:hypothetical protein